MYKYKYLKYKKKYIELKNNMNGNGIIRWAFDEVKFNTNTDETVKGTMSNGFFNECNIDNINNNDYCNKDETYIGNIKGTWIGEYKNDYDYEGKYYKDDTKSIPIDVNKIGMWQDDQKIYYGIYNNNINNINQYEKKDNDQFCSRFQWYGSESYLDVIIPKQDTDTDKKIKILFNANFNKDKGWEFSQGYGDGFCGIYAFFLGFSKISKKTITFPTINIDDNDSVKNTKTNTFIIEYIEPLFKEIFDNMQSDICVDDIGIEITIQTRTAENTNDICNNIPNNEIDAYHNKVIFINKNNISDNINCINYAIHNNIIGTIGCNIFNYISKLYNVNIIILSINAKTQFNIICYSQPSIDITNTQYSQNARINILLKYNTIIIYIANDHYFVFDNEKTIEKFNFLIQFIK